MVCPFEGGTEGGTKKSIPRFLVQLRWIRCVARQTDIVLNTAMYMECTIKWLDSGEIANDIVLCISEIDQPQLDESLHFSLLP
jgi:hypothetical protein